MNAHVIMGGRLVEDPREFKTKAGESLMSIRVADNPSGKRDGDESWFVEVTLGKGLANLVRERGLRKGDQVNVVGQLHRRLYERKTGGKGESHELRFVDQFQIVKCAADGEQADAGFGGPSDAGAAPEATEDPYGL